MAPPPSRARGQNGMTLLAALLSLLSTASFAGPGGAALRGRRGGVVKGGLRAQLHRALSKLGQGSRAVNWHSVKEGKVSVNGTVIRDPLVWVDTSQDLIRVEGRLCTASSSAVWMLHKPAGYQTARRDDRGRRTVYDLLSGRVPKGVWLFPVGRLDADTEGMLLFTNDGALGDKLTDPKTCVWKEYLAWVKGKPSNDTLEALSSGVLLDGARTRPAYFSLADASFLGKHLVSRSGASLSGLICESNQVVRLMRVCIGSLVLGDLASGALRQLSAKEIEALSRGSSTE